MNDAYDKFKDAVIEAENLRHEAYEETRRRQKVERDLADATRIVSRGNESKLHCIVGSIPLFMSNSPWMLPAD